MHQMPPRAPYRAAVAAVVIAVVVAVILAVSLVRATPAQAGPLRLAGIFSVGPGEVDFGGVTLGTAVETVVTARNEGDAPLTFDAATLSGAQAGEFGLDAPAAPRCAAGLVLAPGAFCEVGVRFQPTATGGRTATLTLTSGATAVPVGLTGTGVLTPPAPAPDTTGPRVVSRTPAAGARRVPRTAPVEVAFSEAVLGVSRATFTLTDLRTGRRVRARVVRVGPRWRLDPRSPLAAGTRHRVRLAGGAGAIRDRAGNPLAEVRWAFTTRR